ncbi:hypothetical protein [Streptomyces sp. AC555_RSS877]|uniref:hypothetical protein n=1 Tax=Streptomyces sp. AC555_RSS877 TaxID=2823688 RepID=UPI001C2760D9|nr:hypothetical protein [Streptomyces sp. AC555_RSS877]
MTSSTTVARTIGANLIDSMSVVGGVLVGTTAGRIAYARMAAGLAAAVITDTVMTSPATHRLAA